MSEQRHTFTVDTKVAVHGCSDDTFGVYWGNTGDDDARKKLIEQGHIVDVLRADAALEGSVRDAEAIVEATLLKAGVEEPLADLTMTMVSTIGRVFLGLGPSYRDMVKTTRKLYGDERTPEQKATDRERLMGAIERLKVKVEKQEAKDRAQEGVDKP